MSITEAENQSNFEHPVDGSAQFSHPLTPYMLQNLSELDLVVLQEHLESGKTFNGLTEEEVVNLFL